MVGHWKSRGPWEPLFRKPICRGEVVYPLAAEYPLRVDSNSRVASEAACTVAEERCVRIRGRLRRIVGEAVLEVGPTIGEVVEARNPFGGSTFASSGDNSNPFSNTT